MNTIFKKRLMRTAVLAGVALVIGMGIGFYQVSQSPSVVQKGFQPVKMAGAQVGGDFEMVDHTGKTVTQDDYAGQYKLIYFGFTYCPAICPTELQKISQVMEELGEKADMFQPLFVTIDPERDTVNVMQEYVSLFHPKLVGLTGNAQQLDAMKKQYRVFAKKVETAENNDYTMDHSSFIYLMNPDNELLSIYRIQDDAAFILKDINTRF